MKNFNQFILTLLAAGLLASCSLTEEPTSFVNRKSFYKNESQCIAALNSCYMPANAIYTANFMLVTEACTDIWYSSSTTVDACLDVTPAKPQYGKNVWTQGYKGVMYCNECVECISSADLADGVKMPLAAEARVMRAFYYYVLTCMFGDVPFYTTMVDTDQRLAEIRRLPRTPAHEIRQELYDDLERNALPWFTAENGRKCRASEAVDNRSGYALALMLMAKFAMWNEDWNGALVPLQALEELYGDFNEGNYPLAETQWRYKNPAESIFEIQHAWSLTGTQYNGNVAAIMMPTHNGDGVFDGVPLKGYGTSMPGWSSLRANNRYAIFRPATGNTQTENAAYVDALFNPLPLTYDTYDATLNRYTVKIDREALAAGEIRGQKIDRRVQYFLGLGDLEAGETFKITHNYGVPWPGPKFWCPDIEQNYDSNNYRIFRYADAILMMAECYCNLENAEETMRYLNMVRQRAGVDPVTNFTGFEDLTTEFAEWDGNPHKYSFGTYAKFNSRYAYNRLESITPSDDISSGKTVPNAELFCENHVETTAAEAWPIAGTGNYNNPEVGSLGTSLTCKAYFVKAGVKGWYRWEGNEVVGYNGLRMEFSTASLNGSHMLLGFSFAAGTISATTSKTYPAHWCVEYSVDGGQSYTLCPSAATGADYVHLRSLPWWDASLAGNRYNTCSSAGIGLTDHLFRLPAEVFGRERVMVRIRPYDKVMTVLPLVWNGDTETAEISAATTYDNQLRWGVITLRYR